MHTGQPGFKHREKRPELRVEYIHMSALLGYVVDIVIGAVMGMNEDQADAATKTKVLRALNKVIWIQNDLFARHYVKTLGGAGSDTEPPHNDQSRLSDRCPFRLSL